MDYRPRKTAICFDFFQLQQLLAATSLASRDPRRNGAAPLSWHLLHVGTLLCRRSILCAICCESPEVDHSFLRVSPPRVPLGQASYDDILRSHYLENIYHILDAAIAGFIEVYDCRAHLPTAPPDSPSQRQLYAHVAGHLQQLPLSEHQPSPLSHR